MSGKNDKPSDKEGVAASGTVGTRRKTGTHEEDQRQSKLTDKWKKEVRFEDLEKERLEELRELQELKISIAEELKKVRKEKVELGKFKVEIENRMTELSEAMTKFESRLERLEEIEKEREGERSVRWGGADTVSEAGTQPGDGAGGSQWSLVSRRSGYSVNSRVSITERELKIMKRVAYEKDRSERENNVVLRGWRSKGGDLVEEVKRFFAEKINFRGEVEAAWNSGGVTIARLGREEKIEVMKRKSKLAGTNIFIENDLSYDDRKKQEEIGLWIRERRELGWKLKIGQGRFMFEGKWFRWEGRDRADSVCKRFQTLNAENGASSKVQDTTKEVLG